MYVIVIAMVTHANLMHCFTPFFVAKWKIIYNAELILLQNKALCTYMNFKTCFHNQVMQ